jgi:hypothetical protein
MGPCRRSGGQLARVRCEPIKHKPMDLTIQANRLFALALALL